MDRHLPPALHHQAPRRHRTRKSERRDKKKAKKNRKRSSSSRDSTHVKLKNITDKMIIPKVTEPDTIKMKDFPEVHAF